MRTTSSIAFFCRPSKANKQGLSPLECSVTLSGQRKFLNLPMRFRPEQFNKRTPSPEILEALDLWRARINSYMTQMLKEGMVITAATLREVIQQGGVKAYTVGQLFSDYLLLLKKRVGIDLKPTVYRKYELTAEKALKFLQKDAEVSSITPAAIKAVEAYLRSQYDASTVCGYLQRLKSFCRYGQDLGKISKNPFVGIRIRKPVKPIRFLTEEQIMDLLGKTFKPATQRAVDLLLVACGTGMAYSDLQAFSITDLKKETVGGQDYFYIQRERLKTGRTFSALVLPFALPIIFHYCGREGGHLPYISNQKLNKRLKEVDTTYTCHLGRRSYASFLANRNASTSAIAAALGDSPAVTVRYYAKYLTTTAIKEQIKVLTNS